MGVPVGGLGSALQLAELGMSAGSLGVPGVVDFMCASGELPRVARSHVRVVWGLCSGLN